MKNSLWACSLVAASVVGVGCGEPAGSEYNGVYSVEAATANGSDCNDPGPDVSGAQSPFFYIERQEFFGQGFLAKVECNSVGECQADAADDAVNLFGVSFSEQDGDAWTGQISSTFTDVNGCGGNVNKFRLTQSDTGVQIETRSHDVTFTDADCGSDAAFDKAAAAANDSNCVSRTSTTGKFEAGL